MTSLFRMMAILLVLSFSAQGQADQSNQKGVSPVSDISKSSGNTFALVVGISDYQEPMIPDLKYADRDAKFFAEFLKSPAGGSLDEDHLTVLINDQATVAQVGAALSWLIDEVKPGDQAIIYFSGHGDVERKTRSQLGYLLTWDSPPSTYMSGALALYYLQEVVATLSLDNQAKVLVITDACRSGKLAGSAVGGAQLTNTNMAKQFANEIKILSCQPNEYSIEGEQWGGGRGAFSYHLINGFYGFADKNKDLHVTLSEIDRYLEDHVTAEVAPVSQVPLVIGNRTEKVATVIPEILTSLATAKPSDMQSISSVESRGIEEEVLAKVDTPTRQMYLAFKETLQRKAFFQPEEKNSEALYNKLLKVQALSPLYRHMTRNYAAALQDECQQFLNATMVSDERQLNIRMFVERNRYLPYPIYTERAAELLGPDNFMYNNLKAKEYYWRGGTAFLKSPFIRIDTAVGREVLKWCDKALEMEPEMVNAFRTKSLAYASNLVMPDSAKYYAHKAVELAPTWILPFTSLSDLYLLVNDLDRAEYYMEQAWKIDTNSILMFNTRAKVLAARGRAEEAEALFLKAIARRPDFPALHRNMGEMYLRQLKFDKAKERLLKAIEIDPKEVFAWKLLGYVHLVKADYAEAKACFDKAMELDNQNVFYIPFDFACYYGAMEDIEKGFEYLELALERGYMDLKRMEAMPFLSNLRNETDRWNALIEKYFKD